MIEWVKQHRREIGYFIAGWCALTCIIDFAEGNYVWALIDCALVYINIKLSK